jgi:hypothetical protein
MHTGRRTYLMAAVLGCSALATQALAAVIPIASSLQVDLRTDIDGVPGPAPIERRSDRAEQTTSLAPLTVSALLESSVDGARLRNTGTASATWSSASSGFFAVNHLLEFGPGTLAGTQGFIDGANSAPSTGFTYTFSTDGSMVLSLDFTRSVKFLGSTLACCDFWTVIDGNLQSRPGAGFGSTGTLFIDLLGGGVHTIQITPGTVGAGDTIGGALRQFDQTYATSFAWDISPVPEPPTVSMLLAGMLVLRCLRRRRSDRP